MTDVRFPDRDPAGPGVAAPPEPARRLRDALADGFRREPDLARRLARARTRVRFTIAPVGDGAAPALGGDAAGVSLTLDGDAADVRTGRDPEAPEIELTLTTEQADALAGGELPLAAALYRGAVGHRGPVRRFMEIDPILQTVLAGGSVPDRPRHTAARAARAAPDPDLLAIHAAGVEKSFGEHRVLEGVDLEIPEGAISVVLGPSGSGKSVLFQHLIGALTPDAGEVRLRGVSVGALSRAQLMALRREVGVMFQDGALFTAMNVFDNVAFPLREHTDLIEREIREVVFSRLSDVGLADAAGLYPRELSGGMRKRAGLARALVLDPAALLCDEPDSGLDPVRTALIGDLLTEHHARGGGVILVVTHDITLARQIADHVSVLWQGRIVAAGPAENVFAATDPFVRQFLDGRVDGPLGMG